MTDPNERPLPDEAATPAASMTQEGAPPQKAQEGSGFRPSYLFLALVAAVTIVADLGTKHWALRSLETSEGIATPMQIVEGKLAFVLARNPGGAWGFLAGASEAIRKPFFLLVTGIAIVTIVAIYRRLAPTQRALKWALPLVLGGAIGNLVDRIRFSWVVDFIDVHIVRGGRAYHWPTFNIADVAICVGLGLMFVDVLGSRQKAPLSEPIANGADAP